MATLPHPEKNLPGDDETFGQLTLRYGSVIIFKIT
jgi:hypothetical protein